MQSTAATIVLYGIPNCDTVKKARTWLQEQQVEFVFHDVLINRKGTTWRALSDEQKASATDTDAAIALMLASPSIIKRPVLQQSGAVSAAVQKVDVGFSTQQYEQLLK